MPEKLAISDRPINLVQVLKFGGLAESGAHAKAMVSEGLVSVNGAVELRLRRQMAIGDVIRVEEGASVVLVAES